MIQPNELRIGNIVSLKNGYNTELPKYGKVTQVYMNGFTVDYHWPDEWFEPVELTPDILEAAGFYWSIYHQAYHFGDPLCNDFYDLNECYPKGFQLSTFKKSTLIGQPFFYLHQLQNLYYFLTGEELQIDLTKLNKEK